MSLRYKDIDIINGRIILEKTKNGNPRIVPFLGNAREAILQILKPHAKPLDLLFPSPTHLQKPYDVETAWQASIKRAKIEDCRFHDLRHTTASILAAAGWSLFEIGMLLGHESTQTTKRYTHLTFKHTETMVENLDLEIFGDEYNE